MITTCNGDHGCTSTHLQKQMWKGAAVIKAMGKLDTLMAQCLYIINGDDPEIAEATKKIYSWLLRVCQNLAGADTPISAECTQLLMKDIEKYETRIDHIESQYHSRLALDLNMARTLCREAECALCSIVDLEEYSSDTAKVLSSFMNRLSDWFWVIYTTVIAKKKYQCFTDTLS